MSKTNHLQIITSSLHRTAGPYRCANTDQSAARQNCVPFEHFVGRSRRRYQAGLHSAATLLSYEMRRIAANIAKLPDLLRKQ